MVVRFNALRERLRAPDSKSAHGAPGATERIVSYIWHCVSKVPDPIERGNLCGDSFCHAKKIVPIDGDPEYGFNPESWGNENWSYTACRFHEYLYNFLD